MCPATITGSPLTRAALAPATIRPQQVTVTNNELPGSHVPSAVRRRELLATRNLTISCSPTWRWIGSVTIWPPIWNGVSNIRLPVIGGDGPAIRPVGDTASDRRAAHHQGAGYH